MLPQQQLVSELSAQHTEFDHTAVAFQSDWELPSIVALFVLLIVVAEKFDHLLEEGTAASPIGLGP